ncbi:MAG: hypothetical protein ACXVH0_10005, partial [Thermoanaerobaculia bacterium]
MARDRFARPRARLRAPGVGTKVAQRRREGRRVGHYLEARRRLADALVFEKVRQRFGGHLRFFICGSVLSEEELPAWAWAEGIPDASYADLVRDPRVV